MNMLRKLASQTMVYGLSSIVGRFLNYLLVPLYTYSFPARDYGVVSELYAYAGFLSVALVLGLETGYFRFRSQKDFPPGLAYRSALRVLIPFNLAFVLLVWANREPLSALLLYQDHPEYLIIFSLILALDAIGSLPFARLRAEDRAMRFAAIKLTEIGITIGLNVFFIVLLPEAFRIWPDSPWLAYYDPEVGIGYIFVANLVASAIKVLLLLPEFRGEGLEPLGPCIRKILRYSLPMVVIGFAGIINEMLDRAILKALLPYDLPENLRQLGIYGACYKLSILMTLFVQAFRYAGEPFFFSFQYFIGEAYREGLAVVPILLMANLFLGIYVNLSIWYKLTDRTMMGAWVSLMGALVTIGLNLWWIPIYGYMGAAWATLVCYGVMMLVSYILGRIFYPVPYPVGRILGYILLALGGVLLDQELVAVCGWRSMGAGLLVMGLFLGFAFILEGLPLIRGSLKSRGLSPKT
ncbi:MAG: polysaccharide biosynthesis protein [Gammaproteobacteria bacterium]|nr:polysaccharide biosynthesis protein [Gammaproteobacteria bacterium]